MKPITKWRDQDEAFADVAAGLYHIMHEVVRQRQDKHARNSAPDVSRVSKSSDNVSKGPEVRADDIIKVRTDITPEKAALSRIETVAWETWELATAAQAKIQQALDTNRDLDGLVYKRSSRIKNPARIREALLTRRTEQEQDYITSVQDACGFRLITLFQSDIPKVLSLMLRLAAHDPDLGKSPFKRDGATEVTIYTDRPSSEPLSIERTVTDTIHELSFCGGLNIAPSSIAQFISAIFECEVSHFGGDVVVGVEFQIISVFEDAWGELHHKLIYSPSHSGVTDPMFLFQNRHLLTLKKMLHHVSEMTDEFKTFLQESEKRG
jgi:ppGpp synthetase/RelA/SpoT-type nucleotidyltranferase